MIGSRVIPNDVSKEIRALAPLWLGCVVGVWAGGLPDSSGFLFRAGFLVYLLGSAALGALSVGHEYTNRTLSLLLSAPTSRRRIFTTKAGVLLPMLLILATVALTRLPVVPAGLEMEDTARVGLMSLLGAAFLAPWLTIVCRNPIAGALFALAIPAGLLVGSELVTAAVYGVVHLDTPIAERFRMQVVWASALVLVTFGAFSSWRAFMRLEAIEGPHGELRVPAWLARSRANARAPEFGRRHPAWKLLMKELRLQQLTFVVSGLYLCGWVVILLVQRRGGTAIDQSFLILTVVHGVMVALLAGGLASAEERHLGTLEWQVLLPMPASRQWLVKIGVVFGVVGTLGLALPALLAVLDPSIEPMRINPAFVGVVLAVAAVSLYVSSLCSSGVKALLISVPATAATLPVLLSSVESAHWLARAAKLTPGRITLSLSFTDRLVAFDAIVMIALLVALASINHRSSDRGSMRVWRQLIWIVGAMVGSAAAFTVAQMLVLRR